MDMSEETRRSQEMFSGFVKFSTYATAGIVVVLILMALFLV